jgi:hypothetical protein
VWRLGTRAAEQQVLRVIANTIASQAQLEFAATAVPHIVSQVVLRIDTTAGLRVGDSIRLDAEAIDPYGNVFPAPSPVFESLDTTIARAVDGWLIGGPRRGRALVRVQSAVLDAVAPVPVFQRVSAIVPGLDTVYLTSLGSRLSIPYVVRDDRGGLVRDTAVEISVADSDIVQLPQELVPVVTDTGSALVIARANGVTQILLSVPEASVRVPVVVAQVPASVTVAENTPQPIMTLPVGATLPITCRVLDANGNVLSIDASLIRTASGTVAGQSCTTLRVIHSGVDTLVLGAGPATTTLPVIVAAAPIPSSTLGDFITADTLPGATGHWAPSARVNADNQLEVYYTAYSTPDSLGYTRGDLHRLLWLGGAAFKYDGVALGHDDDICSPQGQGIENIAVVPRADSAGWRMFYAAGSNDCYGWQVFSAVSIDGKTWVKEPGVRLSNGGVVVRGQPPWPVGEGMVLDQLASGEWRMTVGSFEHVDPPEPHWQITEWRSVDQINWRYIGPVLTTREMPVGWQDHISSPAIREFRPGLWRMLFTARGEASRSALWSAVSTDREHWQVEGEVLGDPSSNLYYAALAGDHVVFVRQDDGGPLLLAIAGVQMP